MFPSKKSQSIYNVSLFQKLSFAYSLLKILYRVCFRYPSCSFEQQDQSFFIFLFYYTNEPPGHLTIALKYKEKYSRVRYHNNTNLFGIFIYLSIYSLYTLPKHKYTIIQRNIFLSRKSLCRASVRSCVHILQYCRSTQENLLKNFYSIISWR